VEPDEINLIAVAVLGYFEQIDHAQEARLSRQLRSDFLKGDWLDGIYLDLAFFHAVTVADPHVRARPDSDAAGDLPAANPFTQSLGEGHSDSLA